MPIAFTSRIIWVTFSISRPFGLRHAAPMQKRLAPAAFAARASFSTASTSISLVAFTGVSKLALCEQ